MKKSIFYFSILSLAFTLVFVACQSNTSDQGEQEKVVKMPVTTQSEEAKAALYSGLEIWDLGNSQDAHTYFAKAIEKDPKLAIAHAFAGATGGSAKAFGTGLANAKANLEGASDFEKQMVAYMATYATSDLDGRLTMAKKMAADYPDMARCQINLGNNYWESNDVKMSRESYQKALNLDPSSTSGYDALARSYLFAEPKDLQKAESTAAKVVEMAESNPRAHILLGDCYRGQNKLEEAKGAYSKAIALAPEDFQTYYKRGHANTFLGNMAEARTDFQKGRQYDEDKYVAFEAYTYLYDGDPKTALSWLEGQVSNIESLGLSVDNIGGEKLDMLDDCAWMAFHQKDAAKMKTLKGQMVSLSEQQAKDVGSTEAMINHNSDMLFWEVLIAALEGKTADANTKLAQLETSRKPINNARKLEDYHFANGFVHLQQKDFEGAIAEFEMANKNWIYNQYWQAKANEKAGNKEKAQELYRKIADNNFNSVFNALVRKEVKQKTTTS